MKAWLAIALAAAVLAATGCSPAKREGSASPALARVNGSPITVSEVQARLRLLRLGYSNISAAQPDSSDVKMDILSQLVEEEMLVQEAAKEGIAVDEKEVEARYAKASSERPSEFARSLESAGVTPDEYKEDLRRKLTVEKLLDARIYSKIKITRQDAERFYEEHREEFKRPATVRARQIVVDNPQEARKILEEARKKGADFAGLARRRSLSPDSAKGGDLGYFSRGEMPPQFDVVFRMKPGQISNIVKTPYGYHIFKVEDTAKAEDMDFAKAEPEAARKLAVERGEDEYRSWLAQLKARTKIEINSELLKTL